MIVDPDFPDHWKTRMLVDSLSDESAPVYLLRLWAHCQNRRSSTFENMPQAALKALCRYPGHPSKLESCLVSSGFVRREGHALNVCKWDHYNASLIANWENGKRGGRPPKAKPNNNPPETHGLPTDNPSKTRSEPIREDRSREDKNSVIITQKAGAHSVPSLDESKAYARSAPMPISEACVVAFYDTQEANGWITKHGHSIADWRAALRRYASHWNENEKSKPPTKEKPAHRAGEYPEPSQPKLPRL